MVELMSFISISKGEGNGIYRCGLKTMMAIGLWSAITTMGVWRLPGSKATKRFNDADKRNVDALREYAARWKLDGSRAISPTAEVPKGAAPQRLISVGSGPPVSLRSCTFCFTLAWHVPCELRQGGAMSCTED